MTVGSYQHAAVILSIHFGSTVAFTITLIPFTNAPMQSKRFSAMSDQPNLDGEARLE